MVTVVTDEKALVKALTEDYAKGKQSVLEFDLGNGNKSLIPVKPGNMERIVIAINKIADAGRDKINKSDFKDGEIARLRKNMLSELNSGLHQLDEVLTPPSTPVARNISLTGQKL